MKYIKTYENFNPGDFLDDFDIDLLTHEKLTIALLKHNFFNDEIKKILMTGEVEDYTDTMKTLVITNKTLYSLTKAIDSQNWEHFKPITSAIKSEKLYPFLDINWEFTFVQGDTEKNGKINMSVVSEMTATHKDFPKFKVFAQKENLEAGPTVIGCLEHLLNQVDLLYMTTLRRGFNEKEQTAKLAGDFADWLDENGIIQMEQ